LPVLSKLCELVIKDQISKFMENNVHSNFYQNQSGFRACHSTITAMLGTTEKIRENIDKKFASILLLLDFSKAFDTINHSTFCQKLVNPFHFSFSASKLIFSYLSDRVQYTSIENNSSSPKLIGRGVPQGSILGPLLFNCYINDLPSVVDYSLVHIFADDVQLLVSCDIQNLNDGVLKMNHDLNKVHIWARSNELRLNVAKTQAIAF